MYRDGEGRVCSLPSSWTTAVPPDPYVVVSAGRSVLRLPDLLVLTELLRRCRSAGEPEEIRHGCVK